DAWHPAQQEITGIDLPVLLFVISGRNFGEQHDVGERLGGVVPDERFAAFRNDGVVEVNRFREVPVHGGKYYSKGCVFSRLPLTSSFLFITASGLGSFWAGLDYGLSALDSRHSPADRDAVFG